MLNIVLASTFNARVSRDAAAFYLYAFAHAVDNYFAEQAVDPVHQ